MKYTIEKSSSAAGSYAVMLEGKEVKHFWSKSSALAWALTH
jgi:hypothetical protein